MKCVECGADFTPEAGEPERCAPCREARRGFFTAICAGCGQEAFLPFRPQGDRPVYCADCFSRNC